MKYTVGTWFDDQNIETEVTVRSNAKNVTVWKRCMEGICKVLWDKGILDGAISYHIDRPNIWTNGYFSDARLYDAEGFAHAVYAIREDGAIVFTGY